MTYDQPKERYTTEDLMEILRLLRDPEHGCPWDKVQTHSSIRMNFLEEAYEAVDAIDRDDPHLMCEELGDVLMQVAFHCMMEEEAGRFTLDDVCRGVCQKLIARHPFIFDENSRDVIKNWDALKNKEKGRTTARIDLEDVPPAMPALMRAAKLQKRAAGYGCVTQPAPLPAEETDAETAVGDALFALVAAARAAGVDPEQALQLANSRFTRQVIYCEEAAARQGKDLKQLTREEREALLRRNPNK